MILFLCAFGIVVILIAGAVVPALLGLFRVYPVITYRRMPTLLSKDLVDADESVALPGGPSARDIFVKQKAQELTDEALEAALRDWSRT